MEELIKKLSLVMKSMGNIPKRGEYNAFGTKYNYITHDDIASKLQEALIEQGVMIVPQIMAIEQREVESKSGTKGTHTILDMLFTITDGKSSMEVPWRSEAMDYQDKSIGKAVTYGKKYFVINLFQIATGDPKDDSDSSTVENIVKTDMKAPEKKVVETAEAITQEQLDAYEELSATALKYGIRVAVIDKRLAKSAYDNIYNNLVSKIEEAKKGA